MPLTIAVVQLKGGTGRSTVATNLAGALAATRGETVLVDGDLPQATASAWYAVRQAAGRAAHLTLAAAANHRELVAQIARHRDATYVVLDAPPRLAEMARAMILTADVILVPCGPSLAELWALQDTLPVLAEATHQPVVRLVWTRTRAGVALSDDLVATSAKTLGLAALKRTLGLRVAYAQALGDGCTVAETGHVAAREELEALVREVLRLSATGR